MTTLRIIVVEDDAIIGELLAEMLRDLGHIVCAIEATENAAVAAAARDQPNLILIDVGLGRGSGLRAMHRITQSGHIAHVFMSGSKVESPTPRAVMLLKPFAERDLVQAMHQALATAG
jgi:CheY-like chemotaxis protein